MNEIERLINFIAEHHKFDAIKYPELNGASPEEILKFAVRHSALHFSKTAGKIAAVSENTDHDGQIDVEEIKINLSKGFINALRLAELVGMSEKELIDSVEKIIKEEN